MASIACHLKKNGKIISLALSNDTGFYMQRLIIMKSVYVHSMQACYNAMQNLQRFTDVAWFWISAQVARSSCNNQISHRFNVTHISFVRTTDIKIMGTFWISEKYTEMFGLTERLHV